mgnify:CR=1 FL=1
MTGVQTCALPISQEVSESGDPTEAAIASTAAAAHFGLHVIALDVGDADQLALALTSRFLSLQSGREVFRASVGQIYYFANREVGFRNRPEEDQSASELISEVATNPTEDWSARATVQWDPNRNQTEKSAFSVRYAPSDGTLINADVVSLEEITESE